MTKEEKISFMKVLPGLNKETDKLILTLNKWAKSPKKGKKISIKPPYSE